MKILEQGQPQNVEVCECCGCKFEYNISDIEDCGFYSEVQKKYLEGFCVHCPNCGNGIGIEIKKRQKK